jgi:hypothetical protein
MIEFSADRNVIQPGEQATLLWHVEGGKAVYVFREGKPWQKYGVVEQGQWQVSPSQTTTYCMRVIQAGGSVEVCKIEIQVPAPGPSPGVSVDRTGIHRGGCVTLRWPTGSG